jgi:hypothetical protein
MVKNQVAKFISSSVMGKLYLFIPYKMEITLEVGREIGISSGEENIQTLKNFSVKNKSILRAKLPG